MLFKPLLENHLRHETSVDICGTNKQNMHRLPFLKHIFITCVTDMQLNCCSGSDAVDLDEIGLAFLENTL